jgi:aryl-alcohol dehydrogenase-like predicted oxidoreductase
MTNLKEEKASDEKTVSRRGFVGGALAALAGVSSAGTMKSFDSKPIKSNETSLIKEFRTLGRTGFKVSDISLGGVSLTEPALVKACLDAGINYIDTAEGYMRGQSERLIGEGIKGYDRKSLFITTKIFIGPKDTKSKLKGRVLKCLERLQLEHVDCLMMHSMLAPELARHEGFHEAMRELKSEGKLRYLGVSSHGAQYGEVKYDMAQILGAAAEDGRFDVFLVAYNFLNKDLGGEILRICQDKNIGVTLMKVNPVIEFNELDEYVREQEAEGKDIRDHVRKRLALYKQRVAQIEPFKEKYNVQSDKQVGEAAIKFVLSHPGVHTVTFSIKNYDQINDYCALSGTKLESGDMSALALHEATRGELYCRHGCGACEPSCPQSVPVNTIMRFNHYFRAQTREKDAMKMYAELGDRNAAPCDSCAGHCEMACPYHVPAQVLLSAAHKTLTLA